VAAVEGTAIGKGVELGMALGTFEDDIAVALGHLQPTGVEGTGTLVADKLVVVDPHNDKAVGTPHQIFVSVAGVDAGVQGRVGVDLAIGLTDRHMAFPFLAATYNGNEGQ